MYCKVKNSCYFAVIWTIFQSILHAYICLINVLMHFCQFVPKLSIIYYIYFTYLYNNKCIHNVDIDFGSDLIYPPRANLADYTEILLKSHLILDCIMIVAAVALFCGIFFKIKDVWILVYYLPWIITCGLSIVLDVYSTIQYGTKLLDSTSTRSWLEYVGFEDIPKEINDYEYDNRFWYSTLYAILFFARFGGTFVNFALLIRIAKLTKDIYYNNIHDDDDDAMVTSDCNVNRDRKYNDDNGSNLFSSFINAEERIRRWQEFYGDEVESHQDTIQMNDINNDNKRIVVVEKRRNSNTSSSNNNNNGNQELMSTMPFSYTANLQEIPNFRNKLHNTNHNHLCNDDSNERRVNKTNNSSLNVSLSDEAETTF